MKEKSDEQLAGALVLPPNFDLDAATLQVLLVLTVTAKPPFSDHDISYAFAARNHVRATITRMVEVASVTPIESPT